MESVKVSVQLILAAISALDSECTPRFFRSRTLSAVRIFNASSLCEGREVIARCGNRGDEDGNRGTAE